MQRITAAELAGLLGMKTFEAPLQSTSDDPLFDDYGRRLLDQLGEAHPEDAGAVLEVLDRWQADGGHLSFGRGDETSCLLTVQGPDRRDQESWPLAIYPRAGTVEVVFQYMRRRPVFDELDMRRAFRERLSAAGVEIPDAKLNLRPSFSLEVLRDDERRLVVIEALAWFVQTFLKGDAESHPNEAVS
ncbi:hypothetical protein [Modestobacter sp. KNN46-3]|jgi:hypothetical protein|uniref:hypothetical protein n=1 Tax=Modestobacter sp. KNN46-3 TaxID=2711218 RepID=UPI0013DF04DA|nr:hypothetical protein [Modestobacter sp. KNN46-3]